MTKEIMKQRTKQFALRAINLAVALPENRVGNVIASQLIRSGTSVGANYRAALRARSPRDFSNKIGVVLEETDESGYWTEIIVDSKLIPSKRVVSLLQEANELTAIFAATHKTTKAAVRRPNHKS
ncbi:MAG: four helix bundle protein [Chloroflexi bacterium]|nr:four helix bundle protein [Chloroflexota bacterium]